MNPSCHWQRSTSALPEVFVVCGPTGSGKSETAVQVAEALRDTEIVGVDAYQVYRGMEVLTAAPTREQRARVPHHLVGCADPCLPMSAFEFAGLARDALEDIRGRGKRALLVGGSGLYLATIFGAAGDAPPSDPALREKLEALPLDELVRRLETLDPVAAAHIDRANPRRVVRALEVCLVTGSTFSSLRADWGSGGADTLRAAYPPGVVLAPERDRLAARIRARAEAMLDAGAPEEVRALGATVGVTASQAIGFHEIRQMLEGVIDRSACVEAIAARTRRYARRQMTWFRNKLPFPQIPPTADALIEAMTSARVPL